METRLWKLQEKQENRKKKTLTNSGEFMSGLKKEDRLIPVVTIVLYYGSEPWGGSKDIHGLLDMGKEHDRTFHQYIPNYHINVVDVQTLAQNAQNEFLTTDLQWIFGMLKYKNNKEEFKKYINEHEEYF